MREHDTDGVEDLRGPGDLEHGTRDQCHFGVVCDDTDHRFGEQNEDQPEHDGEVGRDARRFHAIAAREIILTGAHALSHQRLRTHAETEAGEERHEKRRDHHLCCGLLCSANIPRDRGKHKEAQEYQNVLERDGERDTYNLVQDISPETELRVVPVRSSVSGQKSCTYEEQPAHNVRKRNRHSRPGQPLCRDPEQSKNEHIIEEDIGKVDDYR